MKVHVDATAYHEAGHMVAAFGLRIPSGPVTVASRSASYAGACLVAFPNISRNYTAHTLYQVEGSIVCLYAGPVAEQRYTGRWNGAGAGDDMDAAKRLATIISGCPEETDAVLHLMRLRAERLIDHPPMQAAVKALATELLARFQLSGKEARVVIQRAIRAASPQHKEVANNEQRQLTGQQAHRPIGDERTPARFRPPTPPHP